MKLVDTLIEQCRRPSGFLGMIMIKTMERADSGFNQWVQQYISDSMEHVLDIGCGGGKTVKITSKKHKTIMVYGIDQSQYSVKVAKKLNRRNMKKGRVKIQQGSVYDLPFDDEFFDCITAIRTHYFWENLEEAFEEIYRVLKKNGQLIIMTEKYKVTYHMEHYDSIDLLKKLLMQIGFTKIHVDEKAKSFGMIAVK